jgi:ubiquinone/menaquinone biosynthesis C-methylase UbiE
MCGARLATGWTSSSVIQREVNRWYEGHAELWRDIYQQVSVSSRIRQHRLSLALAYVDSLRLPAGARVLDLGSGAGLATTALARRGQAVVAVDPAWAMVRLAREQADTAGLGRSVRLARGDAHALGFGTTSFDLVLALGVIAWLHTPALALREIARVLRPGGHAIVTVGNQVGLTDLLDPALNPLLRPARHTVRRLLESTRMRPRKQGVLLVKHRPSQFDRLLVESGFQKLRGETFGFGPFTFMEHHVLSDRVALAINAKLQHLAELGTPGLRASGAEYIVLARRRFRE